MKQCNKCGDLKELIDFPADNRLSTGRAGRCKKCMSEVRRKNSGKEYERWKRNYNSKKHTARASARQLFSAKDFVCGVISCDKRAEELAHLDYNKPRDVIPLCEIHHTLLDKK